TGLADPQRPLGSFLLLGPTGVGKTESALALCEYLFGDARRMARFDMSEYAAPGSAQRLVGGWGGAEGTLARRVREQPFGIVLLDEVEKAIAGRAIARALEREGLLRRGVEVRCEADVVERVAELGFDARYGARPLNRAVERWVIGPVARLLAARGNAVGGLRVAVRG